MRNRNIRIALTAATLLGLAACSNETSSDPFVPERAEVIPGELTPVTPVERPEISGLPELPNPVIGDDPRPAAEQNPSEAMTIAAAYTDLEVNMERNLAPETLPFEALTHLFLGYADVDAEGTCSFPVDPTDQLAAIDERAPEEMKVIVSVRTWESEGFAATATDEGIRDNFLTTCTDLVRDFAFDGIDIAFPQLAGAAAVDEVDAPETAGIHNALVADLRAALGDDAVLTVAPPAGELVGLLFDLEGLSDIVDWVNLPAYDFDAGAGDETQLLAPLARPEDEAAQVVDHTVADAVDAYAAQGMPYDQMVLAISFRGRVYSDVEDGGTQGMYQFYRTDEGLAPYAEIAMARAEATGSVYNADQNARSPWLYDSDSSTVVAFEDANSVFAKRRFAEAVGLRGLAAFDVTADDDDHTLLREMVSGD